MAELISNQDLIRFSQADADAVDEIFECNTTDFVIDWSAEQIAKIPVLAHYYVKGQDLHYYVLSRVHDEEDDLLTCVLVNKGEKELILFPVRMFNGAVLDEKTQEHAFAEEKLFGKICLGDCI